MKLCIICNNEKDGNHLSYCKSCKNKQAAEYYQNNKEKAKEYYQNNKEQINKQRKEYLQNNKEKINNQQRERYQNNKEKIKEYQKEYKQKNKEKINKQQKEYNKEYYQNNKEQIKESQKEYHQNNPHKTREKDRKRRALKRANIHKPYTEDQVLKLYGKDCHICKKPVNLLANRSPGAPGWEQGLHIDHVIPLSKGGPDSLNNVKPAHGLCNLQKNNSLLSSR